AVKWDEKQAINQIDAAIKEIKDASIDDGKDLSDHPPVDVPEWGNRLQKALELVEKAHADVNEEEDNGFARGLKERALDHIDGAARAVKEGLADARGEKGAGEQPGAHPAYLHALTDLRAARANLEKPANVVVKWDEHRAIKQIDDAIKEIKEAAVDDGKDLRDHPPIDVAVPWKGRL